MTSTIDRPATVYGRPITDADRVRWLSFYEECREEPRILPIMKRDHPALYDQAIAYLRALTVEARSEEWRSTTPGVGGRAEQILPGTPGSFSSRSDWAVWLLMGGRGSGKSRTGAEAVRELLLEREWQEPPMGALVGQTLHAARVDMVERTLLEVMPPGSVKRFRRSTVEVLLTNGGYLRGFSSEVPRNIRGPNFHFAWADEIATWKDRDRSPGALDTTWSNMKLAVRLHDFHTWTPRIIATTTPRSCNLIRNVDPTDFLNPGPGLYDDPLTVVSNMSTEQNLANLADFYLRAIIEPLRGTRLFDQEVRGILMDEAIGAQWSSELLGKMTRPAGAHVLDGGDLVRVVVAVDPSVGAGLGDECGIVVAGLGHDNRVWILEDLSVRAPANVWADIVIDAYNRWGGSAVVAEINNGGELVAQTLGRYAPNLPIQEVWAKKGKTARSEPVALLSDRGRVLFSGGDEKFSRLWHQLKTWDGKGESPDRLDAFVYACLWLLPVDTGAGGVVSMVRSGRSTR